MAISLKHDFVSTVADQVADPQLVKPTQWNEEHDLTLGTDKLIGRVSPGTGAAEEVTCTDFAQSILDDVDEATFKATVNLEIGTDVQAWDADLDAIAATATAAYGRSLLTLASATALATEVDSFFLTSAEGNAAYQPVDATLTALAAFSTNGLLAQTAADTFAGRTITGTAAQISVANGDGVAGNPTLSLPADVLIPTVLTAPNTGLHLLDTNASHDLILKPGSDLTADRTLTVTTGDTDIIVDLTAATDEHVLAYDVATNTWRGVAGTAFDFDTRALAAAATVAVPASRAFVRIAQYATGRPVSNGIYIRGTSGGPKALQIVSEWWELVLEGTLDPFQFDIEENGADAATEINAMITAGLAAGASGADFKHRRVNILGEVAGQSAFDLLNINFHLISNTAAIQNGLLVHGESKYTGEVHGIARALKLTCEAATTGNVSLAALVPAAVIDNWTLGAGSPVLVWQQTAPAENGVWVVQAAGDPLRHSAVDTYDEHSNKHFFVENGDDNGQTSFIGTSATGGTLDVTAIVIAERTERCVFTAADGVSKGTIDMMIEDTLIGCQLMPVTLTEPTADADVLRDWNVNLRFRNIHGGGGTGGGGQGYGLLAISVDGLSGYIEGENVDRHVAYMSQRTRRVNIVGRSRGGKKSPVASNAYIDPLGTQEAASHNYIHWTLRDPDGDAEQYVVDISNGSQYDEFHVDVEGNNAIGGAAYFSGEGTDAGPHPIGCKLYVRAVGTFLGPAIVNTLNVENLRIFDPYIDVTLPINKNLIRIDKNGGFTADLGPTATIFGGYFNANSVSGVIGINAAASSGLVLLDGNQQYTGFTAGNEVSNAAVKVDFIGGSSSVVRGLTGVTQTGGVLTRVDWAAAMVKFHSRVTGQTFRKHNITGEFCDIATAGPAVNGRDQSGAFTNNSTVHLHAIRKIDGTVNSLMSLSATAPTLPTDYTTWCYLDTFVMNGANLFLVYLRGALVSNPDLTAMAALASGTATTETAVSLATWVPSNAQKVVLQGDYNNSTANAGSYYSMLRGFTALTQHVLRIVPPTNAANAYDTYLIEIPNISQQVYYLNSSALTRLNINVVGYTCPNGDS